MVWKSGKIYKRYNMNQIKFLDLKKINNYYEPELTEAVKRVINSGWYLLGEDGQNGDRE